MDLPDARSLSPESLELLRAIAVRAVIERGMTHREIASLLGVGENAVEKRGSSKPRIKMTPMTTSVLG